MPQLALSIYVIRLFEPTSLAQVGMFWCQSAWWVVNDEQAVVPLRKSKAKT